MKYVVWIAESEDSNNNNNEGKGGVLFDIVKRLLKKKRSPI